MKKCSNCKIEINGNFEYCPLCNKELKGKASPNVFPTINLKQGKLLIKVLSLVSIAIAIISLFTEIYLTKRAWISEYIIFALITTYILVTFALKNYKNILKMMNTYFLMIFILLIIWYFITKSLLITTYFIPVLCIVIYIFNSITMLIFRDSYLIKYTKTILLDFFIGFIPLLLIFLKLTTNPLLSFISLIINLILFIGLLIFCKENIIEELEKIFNF